MCSSGDGGSMGVNSIGTDMILKLLLCMVNTVA